VLAASSVAVLFIGTQVGAVEAIIGSVREFARYAAILNVLQK